MHELSVQLPSCKVEGKMVVIGAATGWEQRWRASIDAKSRTQPPLPRSLTIARFPPRSSPARSNTFPCEQWSVYQRGGGSGLPVQEVRKIDFSSGICSAIGLIKEAGCDRSPVWFRRVTLNHLPGDKSGTHRNVKLKDDKIWLAPAPARRYHGYRCAMSLPVCSSHPVAFNSFSAVWSLP